MRSVLWVIPHNSDIISPYHPTLVHTMKRAGNSAATLIPISLNPKKYILKTLCVWIIFRFNVCAGETQPEKTSKPLRSGTQCCRCWRRRVSCIWLKCSNWCLYCMEIKDQSGIHTLVLRRHSFLMVMWPSVSALSVHFHLRLWHLAGAFIWSGVQ